MDHLTHVLQPEYAVIWVALILITGFLAGVTRAALARLEATLSLVRDLTLLVAAGKDAVAPEAVSDLRRVLRAPKAKADDSELVDEQLA